ncbi:MAG: hypothetical protein HN348_04215, partial [Proteobacteria bacterium]|nr:hypothetical protein [Pseudomonadota bacterium]
MSGRVLSEGHFRVDRRRALKKMKSFQLEDPRRYVLELLAAAESAGASKVKIYNDSDDFIIEWDGLRPTTEELEALFDYLWGTPTDGRGQMLQHLSIGILGALGLHPYWVRVDSGSVRLPISDPAETAVTKLSPAIEHTRCHIRERISSETIAEALTLFIKPPAETQLIQGAARWFPVRTVVNGKGLTHSEPEWSVASWSGTFGGRKGALWILPARMGGVVDVVRHGLTVDHRELVFDDYRVVGWFRDDTLHLSASRSQLVHDEQFDLYNAVLRQVVFQMFRELPHLPSSDTICTWKADGHRFRATHNELRDQLIGQAIYHLCKEEQPLEDLDSHAFVVDLRHRWWSPKALRQLDDPPGYVTIDVDERVLEAISRPVFGESQQKHVGIVRGIVDITEEVRTRQKGELRQVQARRHRLRPQFDPHMWQRSFEHKSLRGAVRLPNETDSLSREMDIDFRIAGAHVGNATIDSPWGATRAILDNSAFAANFAYDMVLRDEVFAEAVALIHDEVAQFILETLHLLLTDPENPKIRLFPVAAQKMALEVFTEAIAGQLKQERFSLSAIDPRLHQIPVFASANGLFHTLEQVLEVGQERHWWLRLYAPLNCPDDVADEVLILPNSVAGHWLRWLKKFIHDDPQSLEARVERARRLAAPPVKPVLSGVPPTAAKVQVEVPGMEG